jgi:hypothetical protein
MREANDGWNGAGYSTYLAQAVHVHWLSVSLVFGKLSVHQIISVRRLQCCSDEYSTRLWLIELE